MLTGEKVQKRDLGPDLGPDEQMSLIGSNTACDYLHSVIPAVLGAGG